MKEQRNLLVLLQVPLENRCLNETRTVSEQDISAEGQVTVSWDDSQTLQSQYLWSPHSIVETRVEIDIDGRFEKVRSAMTNILGNARWSTLSAMWYATIWNLFVCVPDNRMVGTDGHMMDIRSSYRGLRTGDILATGNFPSAEYSASILSCSRPAQHPVDDKSLV
jgi:hypothetical protein